MLSGEEKKVLERIDYIQDFIIENGQYNADVNDMQYFSKVLNLIEKQQKEIEELSDKLTEKICKGVEEEILEEYRQTIISKDKEIEELKEDKYGLEEEVQMQAKNIMLCENALYEIQDKIKAKIEEVDYKMIAHQDVRETVKQALQSLLEKE